MNKNNIIRNMALTLVAGMAIPCQANAQGVIGTKNVAMSDENGAFELKDAAQNSVLQIEAPGCELQIVALQGRKDLAIQVVPVSSSKPFYTSEALSSLTSYHNEDMAKTALSASEDIDIHLNTSIRNRCHRFQHFGSRNPFCQHDQHTTLCGRWSHLAIAR